jgi:hypothetical protein
MLKRPRLLWVLSLALSLSTAPSEAAQPQAPLDPDNVAPCTLPPCNSSTGPRWRSYGIPGVSGPNPGGSHSHFVFSLRRRGTPWRGLLAGDLSALATTLRQALEAPSEPQWRSLDHD